MAGICWKITCDKNREWEVGKNGICKITLIDNECIPDYYVVDYDDDKYLHVYNTIRSYFRYKKEGE